MDIHAFKCKIEEELCGAKEYAKMAIEKKASHPDWAAMFLEMSIAELNHASNLVKMANAYYQNLQSKFHEMPEYITDCHEELTEMYTKKYAKVKYLHEAYGKL